MVEFHCFFDITKNVDKPPNSTSNNFKFKMKYIAHVLCLFMLIFSHELSAQRFNWSTSAGYPGIANGYLGAVDLTSDPEGNVYTFDFANLNQVCQGDTIELVSGGSNLFVYKFNADGELIWGKAFGTGSGGGSVVPLNLEFGSDNNLYALVHINANNIATEDSIFQVNGPSNIILNINEDGVLNWVKSAEFSCPACFLLEVSNNRIYFQAGQTLIKSMEFDQTPDATFAFYFDAGTAIQTLAIQGAAKFNNGDILLAGLQAGDASFIPGDTLFQVNNPFLYRNISYVRLTPDLQPLWAKTFGSLHDPETHFIPVAIDANDQIYTAWELLDTVTLAGTTVNGGFNNWAGTVLSMDSAGNPLWFRELESSASLQITYLLADAQNNVWLTGISSSPTTIGDTVITPGVNGSPILASVNSNGVFSNQTTLNEMPGGTKGRSIAKGIEGQLFLGGNLNGGSDYTINCLDYEGNRGLYIASFFDIPQNPPTPSITSNGQILTASPDFSGDIQWFFNGEPIENANNQSYEANTEGNYSVQYSYDFGCTNQAVSSVLFVSTSMNDPDKAQIQVFPNPAVDRITVIHKSNTIHKANIFNVDGRLHSTLQIADETIEVGSLNAGIYFLQLITESGTYNIRFCKQ
jgi:hypothetical protein